MCMRRTQELAEIIRREMKRRKIPQKQIAGLVGVDRTTFNRKLSGQIPFTFDEMALICERLGIEHEVHESADERGRPEVPESLLEETQLALRAASPNLMEEDLAFIRYFIDRVRARGLHD